jgi:uncharacterized membrane protein
MLLRNTCIASEDVVRREQFCSADLARLWRKALEQGLCWYHIRTLVSASRLLGISASCFTVPLAQCYKPEGRGSETRSGH